MCAKPIKKLYYSISEVSDMTTLKQYVLRYWETEFEDLKPSKNRAGNRIYKEKDILLIKQIKDLLYNRKFTIEGARNYLRQMSDNDTKGNNNIQKSFSEDPKQLIKNIKLELEEVLSILDNLNSK
ncbi:MerR family transcriptional regulator [candidate division KSB1 bacterium]